MFKREMVTTHICPECNQGLRTEGQELRCAEHGAFFAYGPQLLVRCPAPEQPASTLMPWEKLAN